jgi:hypothetical protein
MAPNRETQEVYNLLCMLSKQKQEVVTFFKTEWEAIFSAGQVPPTQIFNGDHSIVRVDRLKAIAFIKEKYNFYTKEERQAFLEEIAKEIEEENYER